MNKLVINFKELNYAIRCKRSGLLPSFSISIKYFKIESCDVIKEFTLVGQIGFSRYNN